MAPVPMAEDPVTPKGQTPGKTPKSLKKKVKTPGKTPKSLKKTMTPGKTPESLKKVKRSSAQIKQFFQDSELTTPVSVTPKSEKRAMKNKTPKQDTETPKLKLTKTPKIETPNQDTQTPKLKAAKTPKTKTPKLKVSTTPKAETAIPLVQTPKIKREKTPKAKTPLIPKEQTPKLHVPMTPKLETPVPKAKTPKPEKQAPTSDTQTLKPKTPKTPKTPKPMTLNTQTPKPKTFKTQTPKAKMLKLEMEASNSETEAQALNPEALNAGATTSPDVPTNKLQRNKRKLKNEGSPHAKVQALTSPTGTPTKPTPSEKEKLVTSEVTDKPADEAMDEPASVSTDEPADEAADEPADEAMDEQASEDADEQANLDSFLLKFKKKVTSLVDPEVIKVLNVLKDKAKDVEINRCIYVSCKSEEEVLSLTKKLQASPVAENLEIIGVAERILFVEMPIEMKACDLKKQFPTAQGVFVAIKYLFGQKFRIGEVTFKRSEDRTKATANPCVFDGEKLVSKYRYPALEESIKNRIRETGPVENGVATVTKDKVAGKKVKKVKNAKVTEETKPVENGVGTATEEKAAGKKAKKVKKAKVTEEIKPVENDVEEITPVEIGVGTVTEEKVAGKKTKKVKKVKAKGEKNVTVNGEV